MSRTGQDFHRRLPEMITRKKRGFLGEFTYTDEFFKGKKFKSLEELMFAYQKRLIQLADLVKENVEPLDHYRIESIHRCMRNGKPWFEEDAGPFPQDCGRCFGPLKLFKRHILPHSEHSIAEIKKQKLNEKVRSLFDTSDESSDEEEESVAQRVRRRRQQENCLQDHQKPMVTIKTEVLQDVNSVDGSNEDLAIKTEILEEIADDGGDAEIDVKFNL